MMIHRPLPLVLLAAWALAPCTVAAAEEPGDLPGRVRAVFVARCASCHGPDVRKPKKGFGYVTDLQRLAGNPKLIVPSQPEKSKLWQMVESGKMPPEDARTGMLTPDEKDVIHDWIAALPSDPVVTPTPDPPEPPLVTRVLRFLGKGHVVVVHFPIALLLAAAAGEMWSVVRGVRHPWLPVRYCVLLGAVSAVMAAVLGWLLADVAGYGAGSPQLLALHRWVGTTAAVWAFGLAVLSERDAYRGQRGWVFRVALVIGALLIGTAGHLGGTLVHGEDFFAW